MTTFLVVPTFRESEKLGSFLTAVSKQTIKELVTLVVNGGQDIDTSSVIQLFSDRIAIVELLGSPDKYWSGLTNIGLRYAVDVGSENDYVVIANVDIDFDSLAIFDLVNFAESAGRVQVGAITLYRGLVQSSGVIVRSWILCRNLHPFSGLSVDKLPQAEAVKVDFLPTRFLALPVAALKRGGLANEAQLPHYAADYELTHRLKRSGYGAFLYTGVRIECDMEHTGNSVYRQNIGLISRIKASFSIKSEYNPLLRTRFVALTYPWYAIIPAVLLYGFKSLLEILLGGKRLKSIGLSKHE